MQVSVAGATGQEQLTTAQPTYVLAPGPQGSEVTTQGGQIIKQEAGAEGPQTITIRSIDPSIQHQQNIVYSIQPIQTVQQQQQPGVPQAVGQPITVKTEAGTIAASALSPPASIAAPATPKTPKTMSAKKGNKKNVWVPGKPLTPKAREMMESGKGSMNQDGRWTCVECNRSLSNEWTLEQHIQTVHGERIFNCKSCNKAFKRRDHLLNHIKTIHKGLKPCKKCNVVFVNKEELRAHKMAVHLKLAPEDTAPPPLAKNTAQEYMEEETPASTPAHRAAHQAAQAQQQQQQQTHQVVTQQQQIQQPVQVRSNNVVASYDNLLEGFSIPQQGGQQVVVTINPQHLAQAGAVQLNQQGQQVTYQQQPISVVPVQMGQIQGGQQVAYITAPPPHQVSQQGQLQATQQVSTIQPQFLEMNPNGTVATTTTAAQNGTQSPVKPTITYRYIVN